MTWDERLSLHRLDESNSTAQPLTMSVPILQNSMSAGGKGVRVAPQPLPFGAQTLDVDPASVILPFANMQGPLVANSMEQTLLGGLSAGAGAAPAASKAAARLLAKTAQEKLLSVSTVKPLDRAEDSQGQLRAAIGPSRVDRERELLRAEAEKAKIKVSKTKIRVSLLAAKHLPKMDTFGKTDAYCVLVIDNKRAGGQILRRKSEVVKRNLNPEWTDAVYVFDLFDYPTQVRLLATQWPVPYLAYACATPRCCTLQPVPPHDAARAPIPSALTEIYGGRSTGAQELFLECWDWDGTGKDERIGGCTIKLESLSEQERSEAWHELTDAEGKPVFGHDSSKSIVHILLERNFVAAADAASGSASHLVGDSDEVRALDCGAAGWDSSARGLMFDVDNASDYSVLITGLQTASGRGQAGHCSYTLYRAPGRWNVGRFPCNRLSPCRYCWICCGSCPSGRPNTRCMKRCCRCTPARGDTVGCCCWGECGEGRELAEPCCEGCIPCCTGIFGINPILFPCLFPLLSCGCGCCTREELGGAGAPGIPAIPVCRVCACACFRDGVHRQAPACEACRAHPSVNFSFCSACCGCCRKKYFDRRRWTRVAAGWADLPSDWGHYAAPMPDLGLFEGGGVLIPPRQTVALYLHSAYPEGPVGDRALAVRGPFTREYDQGDVVYKVRGGGVCVRSLSRVCVWESVCVYLGATRATSSSRCATAVAVWVRACVCARPSPPH